MEVHQEQPSVFSNHAGWIGAHCIWTGGVSDLHDMTEGLTCLGQSILALHPIPTHARTAD
jgi:hypothetical protein